MRRITLPILAVLAALLAPTAPAQARPAKPLVTGGLHGLDITNQGLNQCQKQNWHNHP